jgi:hypothetical protein
MKLLAIITEIFDDTHIYPVRMYQDSQDGEVRTLRYDFQTKDEVQYKILLTIWQLNKTARIDFNTVSKKNPEHNSVIELIGTHDALKVFNTIKHIIDIHKDDIQKLVITSLPGRLKFYEKMLNYFHLNYKAGNLSGQGFLFIDLK